jgi:hypothetical protein
MASIQWVIALRLLHWGVRLVPDPTLRAELACNLDRWLERILMQLG